MTPLGPEEGVTVPSWLTIRRHLGTGAFGVVFEAYDARRRGRVAVKLLRRFDAESLYVLKHEFRVMADVAHPNLVGLYDLVAEGELWFITMELVDGVDLLTALRGGNPERVAAVFRQLAEGVCALHEASILHRDLKPSNVLVTPEDRVVLLDFGLALAQTPRTIGAAADLAGTLAYLAPEQLNGAASSEASDWYSVGVMLHEALTGRALFAGSVLDVLRRKRREEPPPPRRLVPTVPAELDALCRELLRVDPDNRPTGAEIRARLWGEAAPDATAPARPCDWARAPLVGRDAQRARLREAGAQARAGRLITAHVVGPSGIGKTHLLQCALDDVRLAAPEALILEGRCYEQESVPYKALDGLIDALADHLRGLSAAETAALLPPELPALARLFPVLADSESQAVVEIPDIVELRRRAAAGLREILVRLCARQPVVLVIDDLQWGDIDSGALLAQLLRPPDPPPLLILLGYRSEDAATSLLLHALQQWHEGGAIGGEMVRIELDHLAPDDAQALSRALLAPLGSIAEARAAAIARESDGNPLFMGELVRFAATSPVPAATAMSLDEVIRARVAGLPEPARRLLEVVAVAGQPVSLEVAELAAALQTIRDPILGQLRRAHLIRLRRHDERVEVETYHDRIREAVAGGLDEAPTQAHHGRLAAAWERVGGADPETLVVHYRGAGEPERAARHAVEAAEVADRALAFDRAARLYSLALRLGEAREDAAAALRAKLADALANAGRGVDAGRAYMAAAELAGTRRLELQRRAAEQFLISGHTEEGLAAVRSVLDLVGMHLAASPRRALAAIVLRQAQLRLRGLRFRERRAADIGPDALVSIDTGWSMSIGLSMIDTVRGRDFFLRHLLLALRSGEPYRVARALALQTSSSVVRGRRSAARTERLIRDSWALAERVGHPHARGLVAVTTAAARSFQGRFRESLELCARAERILRDHCTGVAWELDTAEIFRLHAYYWMGEWAELAQRVPALLREAEERGDRYLATYLRVRSGYALQLAADDPAAARAAEARGMAAWSQPGFQVQHYWAWLARGEIALYEGRPQAAWSEVRRTWGALARSALTVMQALFIESRWLRARSALALAVAHAATGEPRAARRLLARAAGDARRMADHGSGWGDGLADLVRAGVAATRRDVRQAIACCAAAEQRFTALEMGQCAAAARRRRGELVGGDTGRSLITGADDWLATHGVRNPVRMTGLLAPGRWEP